MLLLIGCILTTIGIGVVVSSKKSWKTILTEVKYVVFYNIVGFNAMVENSIIKRRNITCLSPQPGKVAVITGGTRGIGLEVIRMLLNCDITVILGCRNIGQGKILLDILKKKEVLKGKLDVYKLDVSSMNSVKTFTEAVKQKYSKIHYLINNAGIMFGPYQETQDGYESQFATNYLGHFFLTHLLLPELKLGGYKQFMARIVNVSSCAHVLGTTDFEDINNRETYISGRAYAQSKLALVLFTKHLDNLLKTENVFVQAHSVHPGMVNTDLFNGTVLKSLAPWVPALFFKDPQQGAIPIVYACLSSDLEGKGGTYITNCQVTASSKITYSIELQERLFNITKKLLKIEQFGVPN